MRDRGSPVSLPSPPRAPARSRSWGGWGCAGLSWGRPLPPAGLSASTAPRRVPAPVRARFFHAALAFFSSSSPLPFLLFLFPSHFASGSVRKRSGREDGGSWGGWLPPPGRWKTMNFTSELPDGEWLIYRLCIVCVESLRSGI